MTDSTVDAVAAVARDGVDSAVARLSEYLTFPAISCLDHHRGDVARLCARVRGDLEEMGFVGARILELDGALPAVAAEWMGAGPGRPTVLIYGHLDLQPVETERWVSAPHHAEVRGERLYARGAADDMGGWVSHLAAVSAWLQVTGALPCNVRFLLESEEEIGSPNLERYMDAFPDAFEADVMVLTDCENPSVDVPGLTISLRGLMEVELTCESLRSDVHSGLWGGMVPDPALALCQIIAGLVDEDGRLKVGRRTLTAAELAAAAMVPVDADTVQRGAQLVDGVAPLPERGIPAALWLWRQPAVTILSTTLPQPGKEKNAIRRKASARLSLRLAPDQTSEELYSLLKQAALSSPPGGVQVSLALLNTSGSGWLYEPKGPWFEAADRAYLKSWGAPLARIGVGGSIPFVALFGKKFSDLPLVLNGVMDPETTAHGPNESLHLGVFEKTIVANVHLLDEFSRMAVD